MGRNVHSGLGQTVQTWFIVIVCYLLINDNSKPHLAKRVESGKNQIINSRVLWSILICLMMKFMHGFSTSPVVFNITLQYFLYAITLHFRLLDL